jgi:hypothetical protein
MKASPNESRTRGSARARCEKHATQPRPAQAAPAAAACLMRPCWLTEWEVTYELHKLWRYEQLILNLRTPKTGL